MIPEAQGRLKIGQPVAIVDIGSNSIRLVVYEGRTRAPVVVYNEKVLCGLGRNVATTGRLPEDGMECALRALARFRHLCKMMHVEDIHAMATAAARDAENGPEFLRKAEEACGVSIELLSGLREARLSALGVVSGFYKADGVVGDLGGGSLELADVADPTLENGITLPLGGLALQDLSGGSKKKALKIVSKMLERASPQIARMKGRTFYAVGGTWRSLARLHQAQRKYPVHLMHGYLISPQDGHDFLDMVENADPQTLQAIENVSAARRPLLSYGAIVLQELIKAGSPKEIAISAVGVREGLLFERLDEILQKTDPLVAASEDMNVLRSRSPEHGRELADWVDRFIDSYKDAPKISGGKRLRRAACLLSDIGWRAHPDYRGDQGLASIGYASLSGIDHPGRAFLALTVFCRYEGVSEMDRVDQRLREIAGPVLIDYARLVASIMRVAYPVSVAMEGILPRTPLRVEGKDIVLTLPLELQTLANERLVNRLKQLGKLVGLTPRIEVIM